MTERERAALLKRISDGDEKWPPEPDFSKATSISIEIILSDRAENQGRAEIRMTMPGIAPAGSYPGRCAPTYRWNCPWGKTKDIAKLLSEIIPQITGGIVDRRPR